MQNNLTYTLVQLDAVGATQARRVFTVSDTVNTSGEWRSGVLPTAAAQVTISFNGLASQIRQLLFKNTHASAKFTVVWTPSGGIEATVAVIGPGGSIGLWDPNTNASNGISSLKLTSDTNNGTFELFLGG